MKNRSNRLKGFAVGVGLLSISLNGLAQLPTAKPDLEHLKYTLEEAPDWTNLFVRSSGWFGADGIFAIPLDGARNKSATSTSKNMIIFSDTMIGEIKDGHLQPGDKMIHNSVAILNGNKPDKNNIKFYWDINAKGKPESLFIPNTPSAKKPDYYWLGDGFVNTTLNSNTYIFASRMRDMDTTKEWSFRAMGRALIIIPKGSKPPFKDQRQIEMPFSGFGSGIFINTKESGAPKPDGYIYIYGSKGPKRSLIVARVLPKDFENFSAWRFWDGNLWNTDPDKVAYLADYVTGELSFSAIPDGRYVVVFQVGGMSSTTALKLAASPVGPFGPTIKLYESKVASSKFYTYNAKGHPSLSAPGELLITYNQNAFDFVNQLNLYPNLYHPYFLRLKFN